MGTPYAEEEWCKEWLVQHGDKIQVVLDEIVELSAHDDENAAQAAFLLLHYSASTKVNHLLRSLPPRMVQAAAVRHDTAVVECLSLMLDKRRNHLRELEEEEDEVVFGNVARHLAREQ